LFLNLETIDHSNALAEQIFESNETYGKIYSGFSPWTSTGCPLILNCRDFDLANLWSCWVGDTSLSVCNPSAWKHWGINITLNNESDLEGGYVMRYGGVYNVDAAIKVNCVPDFQINSMRTLNNIVHYSKGINNYEFDYSVDTDLGCPARFRSSVFPSAMPTNTPNPSYKCDNHMFQYEVKNEYRIEFDVYNIQPINREIFMGINKVFHRNVIVFDPVNQVGCPVNYKCPGITTPANAWKCLSNIGNMTCYPIGNALYNFTVGFIDNSFNHGIEVIYGGGYANTLFQIRVFCKPNLDFYIEETGTEFNNGTHQIYIHTKDICPITIEVQGNSHSLSFGGIFLMIIFIPLICYFVVGEFLIILETGHPQVPNQTFWTEIMDCIATGAIFVATCGKRRYKGMDYLQI
jgi:hypothetical protein